MNRAILTLGCILLTCVEASADCAEEVNEAWRGLLKTPFSFEITSEGRSVTGSFSWPLAMHFSFHGRDGQQQVTVVGSRAWNYRKGVWNGGEEYGIIPAIALAIHWVGTFGFEIPAPTGKGMESAVCRGRVVMAGREYDVYEYRVRKSYMGEAIDHQKLYVDALSGLPARQEAEREHLYSKTLPRTLRAAEFRPDPLLKIEPPG